MSKTSRLRLSSNLSKKDLLKSILSQIISLGFDIAETDFEKPWGGYIRVANNQAEKFIEMFFAGVDLPNQAKKLDISPKFLIVEPQKRLSYQYHERRSEFWRILIGPAGAILSNTDQEPKDFEVYQEGNTINISVGQRHRLIGLDNICIITELWFHVDPDNPSGEEDIKRIQDDFTRITTDKMC